MRLSGISVTGPLSSLMAYATHLETNLNFHSHKNAHLGIIQCSLWFVHVNSCMSLLLYNQEAPLLYHVNAVRMLVKCGLCSLESLSCIL